MTTQTVGRLLSTLDRLSTGQPPRILVIGDVMLDRYTWGNVERVSPEAPVLILQAHDCEVRLGGAGSVAFLLRGLGADVSLLSIVGSDSEGRTATHLAEEVGIDCSGTLLEESRPTTCKERFLGRADGRHVHQILRVDRELAVPVNSSIEQRLIFDSVGRIPDFDAVLISDYCKGVCTPSLLREIINNSRELNLPVLVDPGRDADFHFYRDATLIKPNRREAQQAAGRKLRDPTDAINAAEIIRQITSTDIAVVTLDSEGIVCSKDGYSAHHPTRPRDVYDITGAGDTVLALLGFCAARQVAIPEAIDLANVAAGLQVEKWGVEQIRWKDIRSELVRAPRSAFKILELEELCQRVNEHRKNRERIIFTNGCFDLLHAGHLTYLEEAARMGDVLIVAVNSDASVRRLKGKSRPLIPQSQRTAIVGALSCVAYAIIFDEDTPNQLIEIIRPDVLVKGGTYTADEVVGREIVDRYGGVVAVTSYVPELSTTHILKLVRGESCS